MEEASDADADETASAETAEPAEGDASGPGEHTASVTVRAGDSLWSIADAHGEPTDWPEIYAANQGEPQPGGGQFDNPNLIYPGQELDLPAADEPADPPAGPGATTPPTGDTPHEPPAPDTDAEQERDDAQPPPPATTGPIPPRTAEPSPDATRTPPAPSTAPETGDRSEPSRQADDQELAPAAVWMGAGVLAAALVGTLGVRRRLQQRRLRPGRRIPMPQGRAAATEQSLRAAQHPTGFDLLDAALRSLALNLAEAQRDLPVIEAVVLHESKVELHLDQDIAPMKPFAAAAGRQDMWICAASSPGLADEDTLQAADAPYPALVSIGWDNQGHLVLVDLEHVGILQLAGDQTFARHVLQAIAVELANTPLPGHMEVAALGEAVPGLENAAPERVLRTTDLADAVADLSAHAADQRRALAGTGTNSLRQARLREDAGGAWTPHIVLAAELPHGADSDRLVDVLTEQPRTAAAVITTAPAPAGTEPSGVWTLDCQSPDGTIVLPGSGLPVHLQGLSDEHYQDAVELLTLAASESDVPAPAWVTSHDDETLAEDDEDGLPAEYADLEDEEIAVQATPPVRTAQTPDTSAADTGHGADLLTLEKPAVEPPAVRTDDEPAGPSLAEVLAQDDDHGDHGPHPDFSTWVMQPEPEPSPSPTVPCAPAPREAVHAALPPATPPTPERERATGGGPTVLLLGPIAVEGATGRLDSNRRRRGIELAAYLALNPGVDHHAIDDALWPGQLVNKQMRNSVISRTRSWLDKDPDGNAHFPRVQDTGDSRYRLGPNVTCDWTTFQKHARKGLADEGEDGDLSLRRALALVRGRPFTGIDPGRYAWAEPAVQEMVSAITHVAYELSTRRREAGDHTAALWAARTGLLAAEENETLHRQIFLAHHAAGDMPALRLAAATLANINERLGGGIDMDAETAELLRNLLPPPDAHPLIHHRSGDTDEECTRATKRPARPGRGDRFQARDIRQPPHLRVLRQHRRTGPRLQNSPRPLPPPQKPPPRAPLRAQPDRDHQRHRTRLPRPGPRHRERTPTPRTPRRPDEHPATRPRTRRRTRPGRHDHQARHRNGAPLPPAGHHERGEDRAIPPDARLRPEDRRAVPRQAARPIPRRLGRVLLRPHARLVRRPVRPQANPAHDQPPDRRLRTVQRVDQERGSGRPYVTLAVNVTAGEHRHHVVLRSHFETLITPLAIGTHVLAVGDWATFDRAHVPQLRLFAEDHWQVAYWTTNPATGRPTEPTCPPPITSRQGVIAQSGVRRRSDAVTTPRNPFPATPPAAPPVKEEEPAPSPKSSARNSNDEAIAGQPSIPTGEARPQLPDRPMPAPPESPPLPPPPSAPPRPIHSPATPAPRRRRRWFRRRS